MWKKWQGKEKKWDNNNRHNKPQWTIKRRYTTWGRPEPPIIAPLIRWWILFIAFPYMSQLELLNLIIAHPKRSIQPMWHGQQALGQCQCWPGWKRRSYGGGRHAWWQWRWGPLSPNEIFLSPFSFIAFIFVSFIWGYLLLLCLGLYCCILL